MPRETGLQSFVRGLLAGNSAAHRGDVYILPDGGTADAEVVVGLIGEGVLSGGETECRANSQTRAWLKRSLLDAGAFAAQHRVLRAQADGRLVNIAESPLARLGQGPSPFLQPHHLEAGERVRRLVERAELQPRVTTSYSASRGAGTSTGKNDITDLAADARRLLAGIHSVLPADCASVVIDVCGYLKGLQEVERERGWPRRSAKLVLRIGLEHLARHFGMGAVAIGRRHAPQRQWMDDHARPTTFG